MSTYIFNGKIIPEHDALPVSATIRLELQEQPDFADLKLESTIKINAAQVSVEIEILSGTPDISTVRNYAKLIATYAVDAAGYLYGKGYDVEIISAVEPDGREVTFGAGIDELMAARSARPLTMKDLWEIILSSGHLRRALADLRESIRSPNDTGFFCYRAVESIRQNFKDAGDKGENQSWVRLREALRIDRSWIDTIKQFADERRHGGILGMSGNDRVSAMQHAWKVVDRFCIYLHNGSKLLPEDKYEIVK